MRSIRYETEAMGKLRDRLLAAGQTDDEIDTFKKCLVLLEKQGFALQG